MDLPTVQARTHSVRRLTYRLASRRVLWGLGLVVALHLLFTFVVSCLVPEIRDPDQAFKLGKLQECLAETGGDRPLVLMIGSSRVAMGYRPELVERRDGPVYYNYGLCFSGPLLDLITLHRLLDAGIRPHTIILEVWPPHLATESVGDKEAISLDINRLSWRDLQVLAGFSTHRERLWRNWLVNRLESWSTYRFTLTRLFGPDWLDTTGEPVARWSGIHERGWLGQEPYRSHPSSETYLRFLTHTRFNLAKVLKKPRMARDSALALTEFLNICRQHGIEVALIWLPESPEFRNSYAKEELAATTTQLQRLARRAGMPLIDARDWVPEDGFVDGYHMTHAGAELFTRMLESNVLNPYLAEGSLGLETGLLTRKASSDRRSTSQNELPLTFSIR